MYGLSPRNNDSDVENLFEDMINNSFFPLYYKKNRSMKVDIKDEGQSILVEADLPGIKKEEISLEFNEDRLTISVDKKQESEEEDDSYIRKERSYCAMARSFHIPNVLSEKSTAKFEDGVLKISLPKEDLDKTNSKQIEIS